MNDEIRIKNNVLKENNTLKDKKIRQLTAKNELCEQEILYLRSKNEE